MATQLSYPFTKYQVVGSGGWVDWCIVLVGWQLNATARILGGGGGLGFSRLLACKISQKQTNKAKTSVHNRQVLYQSKNWKDLPEYAVLFSAWHAEWTVRFQSSSSHKQILPACGWKCCTTGSKDNTNPWYLRTKQKNSDKLERGLNQVLKPQKE